MAIPEKIRTIVQKNISNYEGFINHLYLDTKGKVTVGVGHLISNKNAVSGITLYKVKNKILTTPATLQEKMTEFTNIAKLPWGKRYSAKSFESHTSLKMKDFDIKNLLNKQIDNFYLELKNIYKKDKGCTKNFEDLDNNVQIALLDMVFNLGTTKLVHSFPKFHDAIKKGEYDNAAKQSHRLDVEENRNKYVKDLLESAAISKIIGAPISQINKAQERV